MSKEPYATCDHIRAILSLARGRTTFIIVASSSGKDFGGDIREGSVARKPCISYTAFPHIMYMYCIRVVYVCLQGTCPVPSVSLCS